MEAYIELTKLFRERHIRLRIFADLLDHEVDIQTQLDIVEAELENMLTETECEMLFLS